MLWTWMFVPLLWALSALVMLMFIVRREDRLREIWHEEEAAEGVQPAFS